MNKFAWLRRGVVAVIGSTVLLIGVAMIALPGPALLVIPLGLGILATEFVWARRLLARARLMIADQSRHNVKRLVRAKIEGAQ